jgi:hypothetical protein
MDWRASRVAADGTHHLLGDQPAYPQRYLEVLKFHAPGLAPARGADGAMHIDPSGSPAYAARYLRTFGFYEGRATVQAADGWHPIWPDGHPIGPLRFAWCGNFQGGRCAAREQGGAYLHLGPAGEPASAARWRYAGDYRDGVAVVQREDGLHTHVDAEGQRLHGEWLLDLDVFHKGYARARDPGGWMHVGPDGKPAYRRRFAAVEPFYNGQARVERADGALEVIDEAGERVLELRPALRSDFAALSADIVGHWRTDAIAAAVELGVLEALPGTTAALAAALGLTPGPLQALLRGLGELGLAEGTSDGWTLTPRGALLRRDHPLSLAEAALETAGPLRARWGAVLEALRIPGWRPADVFAEVARDPARVQRHHRMLRSYARHDYARLAPALGLRGDEQLLEVGGGVGVLAHLLLDAHPRLRVRLLDRPEVVALAPLHPRLMPTPVDLLQPWSAAGDAAVLARVLHDWPDADAIQLLRGVRAALPAGGLLYVVELLLADDGRFGGLCDLHLLLVTGGRERTEADYRALLDAGGFDLIELRPTADLPTVLVGRAR